jgi:hypothetical protein
VWYPAGEGAVAQVRGGIEVLLVRDPIIAGLVAAAGSLEKYSSRLVRVSLVHTNRYLHRARTIVGCRRQGTQSRLRAERFGSPKKYGRLSRRRQEVKAAEMGASTPRWAPKQVQGLMLRRPFASPGRYGGDWVRFCEFATARLTVAFCEKVVEL